MIALRSWCVVVLLVCMTGLPVATAQDFSEGFEYRRVAKPAAAPGDGKALVQEFFWYGCPACNAFEPYAQEYIRTLPANVAYEFVPAVMNQSWEIHARAYYTAQVLGVLERIHGPLFDAIHRQGRRLATREELAVFFVEHGVAEEDFNRTFRSFAVQTRINKARQLAQRFGVRAVPTVVVNGQYIADRSTAGGSRELIEVIRFLVRDEGG